MRVSCRPSASSASRIAPMRPSIMSDGAHDVGTRRRLRARLLHERLDGRVVQHVAGGIDEAVLSVRRVGIERDVGDDAEPGSAFLSARTARCTSPSAFQASRPSSLFAAGSGTGKSAIAGMPSA
jgi:hypothetical protein